MKVIKAKKIPRKQSDLEEIYAKFCYHFPQYTFAQARKMPFKRIVKMLKVAHKERALWGYELTQIAASPHTRKGSGVQKMLQYFKTIIDER